MNSTKSNWIKGLDSIRFILALIVMISHFDNPFIIGLKNSHQFFAHSFTIFSSHLINGAAAVTAFYVVSGFVIHYPHKNLSKLDVMPFLIRRWIRVGIPLLIIGAISNYFKLFNTIPVYSLYCELIYYTIYPILFKIKTNWNQKLLISFIFALLFIILLKINSYLLLQHLTNFSLVGFYWYACVAIISLPCWLIGVLLAENIDNDIKPITIKKLLQLRITIYLFSVLILILKGQFKIPFLYSLVFFSIPIYFWIKAEILYYKNHTPSKLLEYMGIFSYSIYLSHCPCYYLLLKILPLTKYTFLLYYIIILSLCYLLYFLVEKPAHKLAKLLSVRYKTKNQIQH